MGKDFIYFVHAHSLTKGCLKDYKHFSYFFELKTHFSGINIKYYFNILLRGFACSSVITVWHTTLYIIPNPR